jgi:hypothetical protein
VKLAAIAFTLAFAASAALQFNDPDPVRWIAIYAAAALVSIATALWRVPAAVYLGLGVIAVAWAALLLPVIVREAALTGTEVEREFGGLLLVALGMALLRRGARRPADPVIDSGA